MKLSMGLKELLLLALWPLVVNAQCSGSLTPTASIRPTAASGYAWAVVATGLTRPRAIEFDRAGNLLVIEQGRGLSSWTVQDNSDGRSPCGIALQGSKTLISESRLNHALALSLNQSTLYVSTSDQALAYSYDPSANSVGSDSTIIVGNMDHPDHVSRTLLYPRKAAGDQLIISRGSSENLDMDTIDISSGRSQVKTFNLSAVPNGGYDYTRDGSVLGFGLRNSVGVAENPVNGGIWSVENSVDDLDRAGQDVHKNNPGEEMNFLGYLNGTQYSQQGTSFGYPVCFAAWTPSELPNNGSLDVGKQFSSQPSNNECANTTAPRLTFQAHVAPLDLKFNGTSQAWISFHGSWNRQPPSGYQLAYVDFGADGQPIAPANSSDAAHIILANADNTACPRNCFRPVGLAFDARGRLFMSSDATGEIYVIQQTSANVSTGVTATGTTGSPSSSPTSSGAKFGSRIWLTGVAFAIWLLVLW